MLFVGAALAATVLSWATPDGVAAPAKPSLRPVPSLEPAATQRQWRRLTRARRAFAVTADCRPVRAVFYAATDWLRLATKLAASASPCAHYYVSIPPVASNKTQPRADQAWRIRALGPSFHALAEIHMTGWSTWVAENGGSWYAAGQEARRRMEAAGYDVGLGDTWAVNEFSSAVRRGDGAARANAREFVRGLYDGAGLPDVRGTVFVIGVGQGTPELSTYKASLQRWLADAPFWQAMAAYVEDWAQELYGDVRNWAVPGSDLASRRDALNQYLQHEITLARAGADATVAARSFLEAAYSPLANAAWQWESAFGWTMVAPDQMQHYVSAQTYALRHADAAAGRPRDHWGFAWAPRNGSGLSSGDFTAHTGTVLDRLAAAIRDSATGEPGAGACAPGWCTGDVAGAWFNSAWSTFAVWSSHFLAFATPPQTLRPGVPSAPMTVQLQAQGAAVAATAPLTIGLTSTSPAGAFALTPAGPWSPTLAVTLPAGGSTSQGFYYLDTAVGSPTLMASTPGLLSATQTLVVTSSTTPPPTTFGPPATRARPTARPKAPTRLFRRGSAGRNVIVGGRLADRLFGLGGNDLLRGRAGNDRLDGGRGRDRVFGDTGADLLIGGPGRDRLVGGRGADRIRARDGHVDLINCGPGRDRVYADRRDRVSGSCDVRARRDLISQ
jgi:RTX calcium-binding nonapeptide repeat (4 copies)